MKMRRKSLGDSVEEIMRFKEKTGREYKKTQEEYCNLCIRAAQSTIKELQKDIEMLNNKSLDEGVIAVCDKIFATLVEAPHKQLEKVKDDFDYWSDMNDKFNS